MVSVTARMAWLQLIMTTTTRATQKNLGRKGPVSLLSLRKVDLLFNLWMSIHELQIEDICYKTAGFIRPSGCPQPSKSHQREVTAPHQLPKSCPVKGKSELSLKWMHLGKHATANATMPAPHRGEHSQDLLRSCIYVMDANLLPDLGTILQMTSDLISLFCFPSLDYLFRTKTATWSS